MSRSPFVDRFSNRAHKRRRIWKNVLRQLVKLNFPGNEINTVVGWPHGAPLNEPLIQGLTDRVHRPGLERREIEAIVRELVSEPDP